MKQTYTNEHSSCTLGESAAMPKGVLELTNLQTDADHQKQGYATQLMQEVCRDADIEREVIALMPANDQLTAFYERFGFMVIQKKPKLMARMPQIFKVKMSAVSAAAEKVAHSG